MQNRWHATLMQDRWHHCRIDGMQASMQERWHATDGMLALLQGRWHAGIDAR